jgi:threonine dehydrogenase-like Zn-dependent dehydrogenase
MQRALQRRATRKWEKLLSWAKGDCRIQPSPTSFTIKKTIYGSWVTSTWLMEELVERLVRWNLHPLISSHRFGLEDAADAYALMASGKCGKLPSAQMRN